MLDKNTALSNDFYIDYLIKKQEQKNDAIITTMSGDYYGKIVAVNNEIVIVKQEGKNIKIDASSILDVQ